MKYLRALNWKEIAAFVLLWTLIAAAEISMLMEAIR